MRWYDEPLRDEYRNKKLKFEPDLFLWRMFLKGLAYKTGGWLDFEYDYLVDKACINPNNIVAVARFTSKRDSSLRCALFAMTDIHRDGVSVFSHPLT